MDWILVCVWLTQLPRCARYYSITATNLCLKPFLSWRLETAGNCSFLLVSASKQLLWFAFSPQHRNIRQRIRIWIVLPNLSEFPNAKNDIEGLFWSFFKFGLSKPTYNLYDQRTVNETFPNWNLILSFSSLSIETPFLTNSKILSEKSEWTKQPWFW